MILAIETFLASKFGAYLLLLVLLACLWYIAMHFDLFEKQGS